MLLKITVPKRTGRKRKRGSSDPFLHEHELEAGGNAASHPSPHVSASTIYRSLKDNATTHKVALAGIVDETHRFRSEHTASKSAYIDR